MKTSLWIFFSVLWFAALLILIVALTDFGPNHLFLEHKFLIVIGFIVVTGLIKASYRRLNSDDQGPEKCGNNL